MTVYRKENVGLKELLLIRKFQLGIYSLTVFLVVCGGFALYLSMGLGPADAIELEDIIRAPQREVASLSADTPSEHLDFSGSGPVTLEIDCSDLSARPPVTVRSGHLRLEAKGCEPKAIINLTNGFEATLFELKDGKYSTDYISLAEGENQLSLVREVPNKLPATINLSVLSQ